MGGGNQRKHFKRKLPLCNRTSSAEQKTPKPGARQDQAKAQEDVAVAALGVEQNCY